MAPAPNSGSLQPAHLVCYACAQKITGTYFKVDDKIFCFDCNEKMGAKSRPSAKSSWPLGLVIALAVLGLAGAVTYMVSGSLHPVDAKSAPSIPTSVPTPVSENPSAPPADPAMVQPGPAVTQTLVPTLTPAENLSAGAVANMKDEPEPTHTPEASEPTSAPHADGTVPDPLAESKPVTVQPTPMGTASP